MLGHERMIDFEILVKAVVVAGITPAHFIFILYSAK